MKDEHESLFILFNGNISGKVRNPVTGVVHTRSDVLAHYRYLLCRSVDDPANVRYRKLLRIIADLLEIPRDIHDELIKEAWRDRSILGDPEVDRYLKSDMDAMYEHLTGERYYIRPGQGEEELITSADTEIEEKGPRTHGILDEYHGIFDDELASTYSLLSEMEEDDISLHLESKVMDPGSDSPFTSSGWMKRGKDHTFH